MSKETIEKLRDLYGRTSLREAAELLHPEAELHQAREVPDADDYYGREEFVRGTRRWLEEWDDWRYLPEEVVDLGDRALVRLQVSGRSKLSGIELDQMAFHLWTFRDGRPWRCDVYLDERRALEAAGLPVPGQGAG